MCGSYPVLCAHHHGRGVQIVKAKLRYVGGQIAHKAVALAGVAGDHDASRLFDGLHNYRIVEGHYGAGVYDLGAEAVLLLQYVRRLKRAVERRSYRQYGHVAAGALYIRHAYGYFVLLLRHSARMELLRHIVYALAFQEYHRIHAV